MKSPHARDRRAILRLLLASATLSAAAYGLAGCGGDQSLALVGGKRVDDVVIDRDPLALLPSGVIVVGTIDARAMFASKHGPDISSLINNLVPLGPESNFDPKRDVSRVYGGLYAMQGVDFCAVVQGTFDVEAIRRAADSRAITTLGAPLVKSRYAENDLYTAGNMGFVVITPHTVITGNETGMRRALDRLRSGRLERSIPSWVGELFETKKATMAFAGDLASQSASESASRQLPFLAGVRKVRAMGNFEPPGMNLAGSLTYDDAPAAVTATAALKNLQQFTALLGFFTSLGGFSIPQVQIAQKEADVAFTTQLDDSVLRGVLGMGVDHTRKLSSSSRTAWGSGPQQR